MKTLVILAAGMGSRFGGLKQIAPLGPNGEFIIDYSIHDAIKAGFEKVVFIIKEENLDIFKETIGKRVEGKIKVEYAFQKIDIENVPSERVKPLGTAHAILCAKDYVDDAFMIINSDDYYGVDSYMKASKFLDSIKDYEYGLVGYKAINTITLNGEVKRGILKIDDGNVTKIEESKIKMEDGLYATPLNEDNYKPIDNDTLVSMNMLLFNRSIFSLIEKDLELFIKESDLLKDEFLIPDVLERHIMSSDIKVKVIETDSTWYGVTYKEDSEFVKESLKKLHDNGTYKGVLWDE